MIKESNIVCTHYIGDLYRKYTRAGMRETIGLRGYYMSDLLSLLYVGHCNKTISRFTRKSEPSRRAGSSLIHVHQGVVTYIPAVQTPATGIKIWSGPFLDLDCTAKRPLTFDCQPRVWVESKDKTHLDLDWAAQMDVWSLDHLQFTAWSHFDPGRRYQYSRYYIYVTTPCTLSVESPEVNIN